MAFLDKLFRWKKKPFSAQSGSVSGKEATKKTEDTKVTKADEPQGSGRFAHVLIRPHVSEKAVLLQNAQQYIFEIAPLSTKQEVARAVYDLYGVRPVQVRTLQVQGRRTRFGRTEGVTKAWKKAIVTLPAGKNIDVYKK